MALEPADAEVTAILPERFSPGLVMISVAPGKPVAYAIDRAGKVYHIRPGNRVRDAAVVAAVREAARKGGVQAVEQDRAVNERVEAEVESLTERLAAEAARLKHEHEGAVDPLNDERRTAAGIILPGEV